MLDQASIDAETERQMALSWKDEWNLKNRFWSVAFRVTSANSDLCGDARLYSTFVQIVFAGSDKSAKDRARRTVMGIKDRPVMMVVDGGPAARAGLLSGDELLSINGAPIENGPSGTKTVREFINSAKNGPVDVVALRSGASLSARVIPENICFDTNYQPSDVINAFADGRTISVTSGMIRFAQSDDELALVIGHEMAHNLMEHIAKKKENAAVGMMLGAVFGVLTGRPDAVQVFGEAGAGAYSQDFETEADIIGAYLTARAGYKVGNAADVWRRMAVRNPLAIHARDGATHPSTVQRFLTLEKVAQDIEARRAAGQPLVPPLKK